MGYINHHAIIVTSFDKKQLSEALEIAKERDLLVTEIVASKINGYNSFFIAPDGSKEGWSDSDDGDACRGSFINNISHLDFVEWVEVSYSGDDNEAKICRNVWEAREYNNA